MSADKVRADWARLASLAEVHEQDGGKVYQGAADRLWRELERLRGIEQRAEALRARWTDHPDQTIARAMQHALDGSTS